MNGARGRFRVGLQAKVLVPVVAFLVVLPAVTLWMVDRHLTREMEDEATRAVATAESVFVKSLENRNRSVRASYESVVAEARFKVLVEIGDAKTLEGLLGNLMPESSDTHEALLLVNARGEPLAGRRRSSGIDLRRFADAAGHVVAEALRGEAAIGGVGIDGRVYSAIAVPVTAPNGVLVGALAVAVRIAEPFVADLKLRRTEVLLVAGDAALVSTLPAMTAPPVLAQGGMGPERIVLGGEHFMARTGPLDAANRGPAPVRYVVLSSYEQRLQALQQTRHTLTLLAVVGALGSALLVGWLVRKATRPLRELSESAEAVGRGDFSRRIARFSNDECGDLAEAFNRMTASLQTSRAELERAMQQVRTTQEQLIQSEKLSAVGQFVAGVAHELNNPLTAVVGFSELLQSMSTDEKMREHLDRIAKSAHRCHRIVHSLLSFARQHAPERRLVQLHEVVDEVLDIMTYDLRTSNVTIVRDFAARLPATMADPHQLQQVFVNILGNARQAIEPVQREGRITIRTRQRDGMVVVEFQDNGPGIRPDHLARIFDPFFTTKPVGKGTGLGLSLCYGIIQEHGGRITARSEVGQGATFAIELPVAAEAKSEAEVEAGTAAPVASAAKPPTGKSVLVIDDEQWILELARELVRAEGHAVQTAMGGQQALELLGRGKFDVIVSDWKMPGLNGVRLYEHLRTTDPVTARRVVFMTGDVVSDTRDREDGGGEIKRREISARSRDKSESRPRITRINANFRGERAPRQQPRSPFDAERDRSVSFAFIRVIRGPVHPG